MMVNRSISAENFSQLYASLETLDVSQIVSTLMSVAPLREEVLKQVKPAQRKVNHFYIFSCVNQSSFWVVRSLLILLKCNCLTVFRKHLAIPYDFLLFR